MADEKIYTNIGHVTAYAYAKSKGYTGTEEQFATDQANFAANAQQVREDKESVEATVATFDNTTVPAAVQTVTAEGTRQVGIVGTAGDTQVARVQAEGTTQVGVVQTEGTTQKNAVQAKGDEVIASIPSDYTELTEEVEDLKSATGAYTFLKDKSINYTAPTTINNEVGWECVLVECEEGDTFYVRGRGGNSSRLWFFSDANGDVIQPIANAGLTVDSFVKIVAPQGAKFLSVNSNYTVVKGELSNDNSILQNQIDTLSNTVDSINVLNSTVFGNVDKSDLFEIGNIFADTSGWTYSNSNTRVRTRENKTIFLEAGDVIGLKDYTHYRQYIGYKVLINGSYGVSGEWLQTDYVAKSTGEYAWVVTAVPETRVTNLQTYVDQITIKRMRNIENASIKSNIKNVACHRGYASIAPENTIPAFKLAKQMGYNTVETDVAFTSDSVPVLLHDSTIDRTSDGTGNIEDLTYDYVRTLDFGSWKSSAYAGTKIPSFEEFCVFCRSAGLKAYAELKATENTTKAQMKQLVDIATECGMIENISWISFSKQLLLWVAEYLPDSRYGLIASSISATTISDATTIKAVANNTFISAYFNYIDDTAIGLAIAAKIPLEEYSPNRYQDIVNSPPYITGFTTDNAHPDIILLHSAGVIE